MTADPGAVLQALLDEATMTRVEPGHTIERLVLLGRAEKLGLGALQVICTRCDLGAVSVRTLLFDHHVNAERAYRTDELLDVDGPNAGLHRPGDFRLAYLGETTPNLPPLDEPHWTDR